MLNYVPKTLNNASETLNAASKMINFRYKNDQIEKNDWFFCERRRREQVIALSYITLSNGGPRGSMGWTALF